MVVLAGEMASVLCMFLLLATACVEGQNEYDLKTKLLSKYIKTVRPVKNFSDIVQVKFDIALRTVVDLDEKKQMLASSAWIRIYWNDASLHWDPKNYSNIKTINFRSGDIWTPDVVLYNSFYKMTSVIRRVIKTAKAPAAIGAYSQAVLVNGTLYVSGQLGLVAETMQFVSDDVQEQATQALQNMQHILEEAGSGFDKVVKTTILLADINDFAKVNEVYAKFFQEPYPARAAYAAANLPKLARVEIEAVAVVQDIKDV